MTAGPLSVLSRMAVVVTSLSAFMNNTPIVAIFIPILTENSVKSNWVTYEFGVFSEYVRQNKSKTIIPVVLDDVALPSVFSKALMGD